MAMRRTGLFILIVLTIILATLTVAAEQTAGGNDGPADEKAKKTFKDGLENGNNRIYSAAVADMKKADKQDGGHCAACKKKIIEYAIYTQDWKAATAAAESMVADAQGPVASAMAHFQYGDLLMQEGSIRRNDEFYSRSHEELAKALVAVPRFPAALFTDGLVLAHIKQDDLARADFQKFAAMRPADDPDRQRALLYVQHPEFARARMAPPFTVTTLDGQKISLDNLNGKVVLIDFWATWCGPCREALPHVRKIARDFEGQPLVVLSVSLDDNQDTWRKFVEQNKMTWPQYYDGGFKGLVATLFGVQAIPQTFTIDSSGILQDQHIGDENIEGKLKKLVAHAQELQTEKAQ
jgi:thiol-disulfide isomerase/thioredoxin